MQQRFDEDEPPQGQRPERRGGFNARSAVLAFAFCTFVLGGFSFGWLFFANWRLLSSFQAAQVRLPVGPSITVPSPSGVPPVPRAPGGGVIAPPVPGARHTTGADSGPARTDRRPAGVDQDASG